MTKYYPEKLLISFIVAIFFFFLIALPLRLLMFIFKFFGYLSNKIEDLFTYCLNPIGNKIVKWSRK